MPALNQTSAFNRFIKDLSSKRLSHADHRAAVEKEKERLAEIRKKRVEKRTLVN